MINVKPHPKHGKTAVWVENITKELAKVMAETAPSLKFTIDGCVDTSERWLHHVGET